VRFDDLFDDLEGQLEQELHAEELDLHAEEERLRLGRTSLRERILAIQSSEARHSLYSIRTRLVDDSVEDLRPATVGRDWFSAELVSSTGRSATAGRSRQCIIPLSAVAALMLTRSQVSRSVVPRPQSEAERGLSARLTLGFVLRDLCRRRADVELRLRTGTERGTIDRVGRDHLDLAVHEAAARGGSRW